VTGVGAGTATISGQMTQSIDVYTGQVCSTGTPSCPTGEPQANTPGTAHTPTSLVVASGCSPSCDYYMSPPPNGRLYDRHRVYQILDETGTPMTGYSPNALYVTEVFSPPDGNCTSHVDTGAAYAFGNGQFPDDYFLPTTAPNPCTSNTTQNHFVNNHLVSTFSVQYRYSGVTVQ
jgi:hypothetical protein